MVWFPDVVMISSIDLSKEIFSIDRETALKLSLKHRRKHVLRSYRLYGDHAFTSETSFVLLIYFGELKSVPC